MATYLTICQVSLLTPTLTSELMEFRNGPLESQPSPFLGMPQKSGARPDLRVFKVRLKIPSTEQKENPMSKTVHLKRKDTNNTNKPGAKQVYPAEN